EIDDRGRFFAAIDPTNSFGTAVSETLEVDLQIDLVGMPIRSLRVQLLTRSRDANTDKNAEHENVARRYLSVSSVHLCGLTSLASRALLDRDRLNHVTAHDLVNYVHSRHHTSKHRVAAV